MVGCAAQFPANSRNSNCSARLANSKTATRRHQAAFARIPSEEDLTTALYREAIPARALETC